MKAPQWLVRVCRKVARYELPKDSQALNNAKAELDECRRQIRQFETSLQVATETNRKQWNDIFTAERERDELKAKIRKQNEAELALMALKALKRVMEGEKIPASDPAFNAIAQAQAQAQMGMTNAHGSALGSALAGNTLSFLLGGSR